MVVDNDVCVVVVGVLSYYNWRERNFLLALL